MLEIIVASLACHKSIRGREQLNNEELSQLVSELKNTNVPHICPHGRPTRVYFSLSSCIFTCDILIKLIFLCKNGVRS